MKGFKTFAFFGAVTLLGLITAFDATDITNILLPALCKVDPINLPAGDPNACVQSVVTLAGKIMVGVGVAGKLLRWVTTSPVFKPE
jgi:hypothetical protein